MCKVCTEAVHWVALWTRVTLGLGMCKVCTEAVHSLALWTRVTLGLGMCKVCTEAVRREHQNNPRLHMHENLRPVYNMHINTRFPLGSTCEKMRANEGSEGTTTTTTTTTTATATATATTTTTTATATATATTTTTTTTTTSSTTTTTTTTTTNQSQGWRVLVCCFFFCFLNPGISTFFCTVGLGQHSRVSATYPSVGGMSDMFASSVACRSLIRGYLWCWWCVMKVCRFFKGVCGVTFCWGGENVILCTKTTTSHDRFMATSCIDSWLPNFVAIWLFPKMMVPPNHPF